MRVAFILLALANLLDGILTFVGLELGFIRESNPLMSNLYLYQPYLFIPVKLALSVCLIIVGAFLHCHRPFLILRFLTYSTLIAYLGVMSLHVYWIVKVY